MVNPLLDDRRFIECYKGVVVNMEHIRNQIDDDFILDNGEKVPISNVRKKILSACLWNILLRNYR